MCIRILAGGIMLRYGQTRMFFSCTDRNGAEHELVFLRWYDRVQDAPRVFSDVGTLYLMWRQHGSGPRGARVREYGIVELGCIKRLVYIQPDFSVDCGSPRIFLNHYLRCEP